MQKVLLPPYFDYDEINITFTAEVGSKGTEGGIQGGYNNAFQNLIEEVLESRTKLLDIDE